MSSDPRPAPQTRRAWLGWAALGGLPASQAQPRATPAMPRPPEEPEFPERHATRALIGRLRQGGFVLYLRHGPTDNAQPDQPQLRLDDCATQRPLTEAGRQLAVHVGQQIRRAGIPVGEVLASPLCRTRETARLAFGEHRADALLMYTSHLSSVQKKPIVEHTRQLLSQPVPAGSNRVIVAHAPNLADLFGYFVKPEGTLVVIAPGGAGRFEYLASIHPNDWPALLGRAGPPP